MQFFRVAVLASGSRGNATLVRTPQRNILIDVGLSLRELTCRLRQLGLGPEDLDAVLVTHEHTDHVKGLPRLLEKYRVPVYASALTWAALGQIWQQRPDGELCRSLWEGTDLGAGVRAAGFPVSHDALDPHGYCIYCGGEKFTYATDLGCVTAEVRSALEGASTLVLESNHDVEMLRQGPYPVYLKKRILSDRGHLSNAAAAELVGSLRRPPAHLILAHLSETNNCPELAGAAMQQALVRAGCTARLWVAKQKEIVADYQESEEVTLW